MSFTIKKDVPLAPYTTLGVGGSAEHFSEVHSVEELREVVLWTKGQSLPLTILAGGSNVLINDRGIPGLVIRPCFTDVTYTAEASEVFVTAGAGILLDDLVALLVEKKLWGLENLSSIPGTVGAVPIQNVGAYGVEAQDIVHSVSVYNTETDTVAEMTADACLFNYRDSIFKHTGGKKYIIIGVTFRVSEVPSPRLSYRDLALFFEGRTEVSINDVRDAIIHIRSKKFPDWRSVGTAGSFFKNPIISEEIFVKLKALYPDLPGYSMENNTVKISLGWILDHICNMKGYSQGRVGLYSEQALVLVCQKGISATEIENFAKHIIDCVYEKIQITIEREVTILS